jgi:phage head maturation protease
MSKTFHLNLPIVKIDEEQRIVTGVATSEALDSQGDIVDYEASKKAFSDWIGVGNIREMHNPVAIGKGIDVQFNDANKEVIVSAKISESADGENAWTKVKEEILTGFSIGGKIFEIVKDKSVEGANRIMDYTLGELSLVDNPANPDAKLIMVKSADGKPQMTKAGVAVLDGDPRDASGSTVAEVVNGTKPAAGGTKVPKSVYGKSGTTTAKSDIGLTPAWWTGQLIKREQTKEVTDVELKKSVYDAAQAADLAMQLSYLIMCETGDNDPEQMNDLTTAFNSLRDFMGREVAEGDDFDWMSSDAAAVIELATKAIDLRKDKFMAKKSDDKDTKVEKSTAVAGGEERDENAEVLATAEENGRPVNDTEERAAEAGEKPAAAGEALVHADDTAAAEAKAQGEAQAAAVETDAAEDEDDDKDADKGKAKADPKAEDSETEEGAGKSSGVADLAKSVDTLLAKLNEKSDAEMRKVADMVKAGFDKVEKSVTALEDRVKAIESQPLPTKSKASFIVEKGESEVDQSADVQALLKRQEELIAHPDQAKPGEMYEIAKELRKANLGESTKLN